MKNKVFIETHYNYVNQIIQIFGFNNLADFNTELTFKQVKNKTTLICENINKSFGNLKELFVVKEFDLARLDYKLETAEQAYGFLKKLLDHVFIPYETFRSKGIIGLRLIPPNKFYIDYINKMSEIVQNSIQTPESNQNQIEAIVWSESISDYGTKKYDLEYIFGSNLILNDLTDKFDCVDKITFSVYGETDEAKTLELANKHAIIIKIGDKIKLKVDLQHCNPIELFDIPISLLSFHEVSIEIFPAGGEKELWDKFKTDPVLFKVVLSCRKFKKSMPKYISESKIYLDNLSKDIGLSKYFLQKGMIIFEEKNSVITQLVKPIDEFKTSVVIQLAKQVDEFKNLTHPMDFDREHPVNKFIQHMISTDKLSENIKVINNRNIKIISFDNSKEEDFKIEKEISVSSIYLNIIYSYCPNELKKYGYSFISRIVLSEKEQERLFGYAIEHNNYCDSIPMKYIEESDQNNTMFNVIYEIPWISDAISGIYPQKRNYDYILNINLNNYSIKANVEPEIRFDQHISFLVKDKTQFKICIPKDKISDWINPAFKFKSLDYDTNTRNMIAREKINS